MCGMLLYLFSILSHRKPGHAQLCLMDGNPVYLDMDVLSHGLDHVRVELNDLIHTSQQENEKDSIQGTVKWSVYSSHC